MPPVFEAYARVFHPASRGWGDQKVTVRWAEVAEANGQVMDAESEWEWISLPEGRGAPWRPELWDTEPDEGHLPREAAHRLAAILAEHTDTRERCFFAVWNGWGPAKLTVVGQKNTTVEEQESLRARLADREAEIAAWYAMVHSAPLFRLPIRDMLLPEFRTS